MAHAGRRHLIALAVTAAAFVTYAADAPYRLVDGWGKLPAGMEYGEVPGMT